MLPRHRAIPWTMIVLAAVFGATWCVATALAAHLPRLLEAMGTTGGCGDLCRFAAGTRAGGGAHFRIQLLRRMSPMISARLATVLHPIGAVLLAAFGPIMAIPFVLLHGAGNGMLTIARGTLPLALFGPAGYGLRTGFLSAPARILQGGAPLLFGVVLDNGGPLMALLLTGSLTGVSSLAIFTLGQHAPAVPRRRPGLGRQSPRGSGRGQQEGDRQAQAEHGCRTPRPASQPARRLA